MVVIQLIVVMPTKIPPAWVYQLFPKFNTSFVVKNRVETKSKSQTVFEYKKRKIDDALYSD